MKSAWVITREGPQHKMEVIGILSARKKAKVVKGYIEWLYALLHYSPEWHLEFAKYDNSTLPEAKYWVTNTGVPVDSRLICDGNPYLMARLAKNISIIEVGENLSILEWTEPDRIECDHQFPPNITKIPGIKIQAPIHLPLQFALSPKMVSA